MKAAKLISICVLVGGIFSQSAAQASSGITRTEDRIVARDGLSVTSSSEEIRADMVQAKRASLVGRYNISDLVDQSDMVFHGTVTDIQYKLSEPAGPENVRVPYTFVTFWLDNLIHGSFAEDQLTLRFIGGLNEESKRYMAASIVPQFDLGDEEIMFVKGNTQSISPLVQNRSGRLRIVDGRIYTDTGRAVTLNDSGVLGIGARHILEEAMNTTVIGELGVMDIHREVGLDAVSGPGNAMRSDVLIERLEELCLDMEIKGSFVNADPAAILNGPDMTPAGPPAVRPGEDLMPARSDEEDSGSEELSEMERQVK